MKFILIFGPPAVGKMTVGQELAKITELKLFHNHDSLELANKFFDFGTKPFNRLSELFRFEVFKEVAASDLEGMIFTFVWAFGLPKEYEYVDRIVNIFREKGADIHYVELEASLKQRLYRNKTENRLKEKASKRDVEFSENMLLKHEEKYRFNTLPGEFDRENYLRVNNDQLSPGEVAERIKQEFGL